MAIELRQNLKLSQQLLMTPQLKQAIKLLQLSRIELEQFIAEQLLENPILEDTSVETKQEKELREETQEPNSEQFLNDEVIANSSVDKRSDESTEIDWEVLSRFREEFSQNRSKKSEGQEGVSFENSISVKESLFDHLKEQLLEFDLSDAEKNIAFFLIGNLSPKGYLDLDLDEYIKTEGHDSELVEGVLDIIQRLDPIGVGARDLKECLLIQLKDQKVKSDLVQSIIKEHFDMVVSGNYAQLQKLLKVSEKELREALAHIAKCEPFPARSFGGLPAQSIVPDVYVLKLKDRWVVNLNEDGIPQLSINKFYSSLAHDKARGNDKAYLTDKIKEANWLIKSIAQRQRTIRKVSECIVKRQEEFLEKGVRFLRPMILKDVALEIEMHESTISRVTSSKYMETPHGVFELKYFFSGSVTNSEGPDLASESVKAMIKDLIAGEDPLKPYSDQVIVEMLDEKGVKLARRTVAKYREQLGLAPSSKRKNYRQKAKV